ncbi:histidine phosphatase family protein [Phytohabitans sp. ZYX-F-186]|uniref:Histidine phosphatase family protein n=1 Tax=Phytohabitans maris TaxID=3071409 RepID=A0ABU0ZTF1_9ACTN|nr:histidine phosphatase family protein [Phytohabitans sp. ZYX-F-186]MDQ7910294.1 histidine phosphatase family protein [Phytohabitans sp. ZYX-F-186]
MTERTLVLLRHAKAERPAGTADIDRPLTARGHADAAAAGAWLTRRDLLPAEVICSPAKRTRQTWHGVALALGGSGPEVRYEPIVYGGTARDLLDLIRAVAGGVDSVLVIGHNPTVSDLSGLLDPAAARDSDGLRTSGLAVHRFEGAWADVEPGKALLTDTHTARG